MPLRICILGATGLVGRETIDLVARAWPGAELFGYASRDQTLSHGGRDYEVRGAPRLEEDGAPKGDLAMVALDDDHSKRYVPRLLELGYKVVDKSNTYRLDPEVPLVAAGVNCRKVTDTVQLVANPNCTTIPLTMALAPLDRKFGIASLAVSTYQAISGAGTGPLRAFVEASASGYGNANAGALGGTFAADGYAGNTVPHNGKTDDSGFSSEERKLVNESRKILGADGLRVSSQCCRVPVAVGHFMNVWVMLNKAADPNELETAIAGAPFVRLVEGPVGDGLSALDAFNDRDIALVGRLRRDHRDTEGKSFCVTVVADNLRVGAATNAVRIASRWFPVKDAELQAPGA